MVVAVASHGQQGSKRGRSEAAVGPAAGFSPAPVDGLPPRKKSSRRSGMFLGFKWSGGACFRRDSGETLARLAPEGSVSPPCLNLIVGVLLVRCWGSVAQLRAATGIAGVLRGPQLAASALQPNHTRQCAGIVG